MDPLFATILLGGGIGIASFILGRGSVRLNKKDVENVVSIALTEAMFSLIHQGYIKHTRDSSGQIVLLKADEDLPNKGS